MNDGRARQAEVGARSIEPLLAVALEALRAGDLDRFSDWLHDTKFPSATAAIDALRTIAQAVVDERLDAGFAPAATVDEITGVLADRCGVPFTERARAHATRVTAPATEAGGDAARALADARAEIERLKAERDALEVRLDELAGAR